MSEYALPDPDFSPGIASHQAASQTELPLQQAYPGLTASSESLQPLEPGLSLVATPLPAYPPSFRDTDLVDPAFLQPVLISLRIETTVTGHRLQPLTK